MKKQLLIILLSLGFIGTTSAGEVETNILKLKALNACEGCNLQEANLAFANLSGANLSGANLSGANLSGANLSEADLSGAIFLNLIGETLKAANLSGADLSGADLTGASLTFSDLSAANLSGANLSEAILTYANLTGANLSGANLSEAYLGGAYLGGANLSGANLSGANLGGADLTGANLSGATVSRRALETFAQEAGYSSWDQLQVEQKKKASEAKRIADAKTAEEAGYSSYSEMQAEEKRIADAKKAEKSIDNYIKKLKNHFNKLQDLELDSLKVEVDNLISEVENNTNSDLRVLKSLRDRLRVLNSSVELKIKTEVIRQRRLRLQNYPGFRDLKPGLTYEDVLEICPLPKYTWVTCYGIDNIKFAGFFHSQSKLLEELYLDMGPIVETGGYLSIFGEGDSNIFIKMKNTFDKKYTLDYGYSERDRQLFNESEKSRLLLVYSKGQVVLEINRIATDYSNDLWLYIHYFDPTRAKSFLEENKPIRASDDDF